MKGMSALIGLTFGFAGGKFLASPLRLTRVEATPLVAQGEIPRLPVMGGSPGGSHDCGGIDG